MDNVWMHHHQQQQHHHHHHQHIMIIVIANIGLSDKEWMMDNPMIIILSSCHLPPLLKGRNLTKGRMRGLSAHGDFANDQQIYIYIYVNVNKRYKFSSWISEFTTVSSFWDYCFPAVIYPDIYGYIYNIISFGDSASQHSKAYGHLPGRSQPPVDRPRRSCAASCCWSRNSEAFTNRKW